MSNVLQGLLAYDSFDIQQTTRNFHPQIYIKINHSVFGKLFRIFWASLVGHKLHIETFKRNYIDPHLSKCNFNRKIIDF